MTKAIEINSYNELQTYKKNFKESAANIAVQAGIGALAALLLLINPIAGAVFGVTYSAISTVVSPLIDKGLNKYFNQSTADTIKKFAIRFFVCIGIAATLVSLFGFPISFASAVALCIFMAAISITIKIYLHIKESIARQQPPQAVYYQLVD